MTRANLRTGKVMTNPKVIKRAEEIFETIWQNDYGLRNILVDSFSDEMETLVAFVELWNKNINRNANPEASNDLARSVIISTEVSNFSDIPDCVPHTFVNGVILNGAITHSDVFSQFDSALKTTKAPGPKSMDECSLAFLAAIEAASNYPIACSEGNSSAQVVHSANTWIWSFKGAVSEMIKGLVSSGQYDNDLRIIVPVFGIRNHYSQYVNIIKTISDTSIQDRLCYLVFAEKEDFAQMMASDLVEKGFVNNPLHRAHGILDSIFSHTIQ